MPKNKRQKIITAGQLVYGVVYTPPRGAEPEHVRQAKAKCTSQARQRLNMRASWQKLELLLAANFGTQDLHVVLTYRDGDLPQYRAGAVKLLKRFLLQLRSHRKKRGQWLKYIYVTEGLHENGRFHHHLVINGTGEDLETIRSLWPHGDDVHLEPLEAYGGYEAIAQYLTKEPKAHGTAAIGERMWVPSLGMEKPKPTSCWVEDATALAPPLGATVLATRIDKNEWGEFYYIKYLLPKVRSAKCRPPRGKKSTE